MWTNGISAERIEIYDMNIYTAQSQVAGLGQVIRNMIHGMVDSRYVSYRLFIKDLKNEYAKSKFGILWDFVDPLVFASMFCVLQVIGVINPEGRGGNLGIPYPVFVAYGFLIYYTFMDAVTYPLDIIKRSRGLLTHQRLAPESLIISLFLRVAFNGAIRIPIMLFFSLILGAFSFVGFLKFLLLFPFLIFVGMSVGIFLVPLNTIYNDVGKFTRTILVPLRFATPVMYMIPAPYDKTLLFNPISDIIVNLRSLATANTFANFDLMCIKIGCFFVLFLVGWFIFHVSIPVLAERA